MHPKWVDCSFLSLKLSFPSPSQFKEIKGAFKNGHIIGCNNCAFSKLLNSNLNLKFN